MREVAAVIATLAILLAMLAPLQTVALQSDPAGTPVPRVRQPQARCDSRQASATGLVSILREPVPEDPQSDDPSGEPVPPAERGVVGDLVSRWSTCLASGNIRGLLGLFTADGVRRLLSQRDPYVGGPSGLVVSVLAIGEVQRLADGRIAARVTVDPSGRGTAAPEMLTFVIKVESGAWYIDNLRGSSGPVGAAGAPPRAPDSPSPPLLRHPIAPGPNVPIPAPGPVVPMRGGNAARSGRQPGPAPDTAPVEIWQSPTGWHTDAQPIVARGLIYFGGFSLGERIPLLSAIDAASGGVRWQTTAPVAWAEFSDSPAFASDALFAPVEAPVAGVISVDAATGRAIWFAPFGFTSVTAPAVDAEMVYVSGWGIRNARDVSRSEPAGVVFALDQRTGRERWRMLAPVRFGPVAVSGHTVFAPSDRGLFAIDAATGRKRWQARFSPGEGELAIAAGDKVVFAGSDITTGKTGVFALDAASGALVWRGEIPALSESLAGTAASGESVFVTWWETSGDASEGGSPMVRAYGLADGNERWTYRARDDWPDDDGYGPGSITAPALVGESLLFGVAVRTSNAGGADPGGLYAVDVGNGTLRWHAPAPTPIGSPPAVLDGVVYAMGGLRPDDDATHGSLMAFAPT